VYYLRSGDKFSIVLVWVDDITAFGNSTATNKELVEKLKKKYKVKVIGEPTLLLGIHITRDRPNHTITLSQKCYVTKILECAGMKDSKPVHTLMDPNVALVANTGESNQGEMKRTSMEYATRIGELLYAAHATRPDILYATTTLAQFTSNPAEEHWTALKRVFRYLKGTMDHVLTYKGDRDPTPELIRYADADWGSNAHRKSISGYVFIIGGGAIAWSSKKQSRTALSTAEAEYVAATHAVKQLLWHRSLL
jgi:Reverse transcriptase (RNA-dependent DNA polymerase)